MTRQAKSVRSDSYLWVFTLKKDWVWLYFVFDLIAHLDNFDFGLTTLNLTIVSPALHPKKKKAA